jgi:hypothetical protein
MSKDSLNGVYDDSFEYYDTPENEHIGGDSNSDGDMTDKDWLSYSVEQL